jgi:hypothetical protein
MAVADFQKGIAALGPELRGDIPNDSDISPKPRSVRIVVGLNERLLSPLRASHVACVWVWYNARSSKVPPISPC